MAHVSNDIGLNQQSVSSDEPGRAAVVAVLQGETSLPRDCCDGVDQVACASTLDSDPTRVAQSAVGEPGIAAMVAMLQDEWSLPRDGCNGVDQVARASTVDLYVTQYSTKTRQTHVPSTCSSGDVQQVSRERAIGDAITAELDLEDLQVKRHRLLELSRDVLEARCPGFCAKATMSENDYLRQASFALASISNDVDEAERALENFRASLRTMASEIGAMGSSRG